MVGSQDCPRENAARELIKHAYKFAFKGLMNDGIGKASRLGSFLSVTTWILLLVAVANPKWTTVGNLGTSGGYNTSGTQTNTTDVTSGAVTISP